jgi:transcriptional regulator with XRE-family HTH domain
MSKRVGARIQSRRKELKMGADELAQKIGKSKATLYRYENGDIENVPLDILEPIAAALEVTPAYLMGWKDAIEEQPVKMAELHFEMIEDIDLTELFADWKQLDAGKRKIVKDLAHNLAEAKKAEV